MPIERKESYRWLENVRQATALFEHPERCVHIGDREGDIYELFCAAQELGTHFLVRTCVDRLAGHGSGTISEEMKHAPLQGLHRLAVRNKHGNVSDAVLEIRYRPLVVLPPIGKQKKYPELVLTVIYVQECGQPPGGVKRSIGSCLPIFRSVRASRRLKNSNGMRNAGRSKPSTKS